MRCPDCDKAVPETVKYCAYCGFQFDATSSVVAAIPSARCGASLSSVTELARHFYQDWEEGKYHLYREDVEAWFRKVYHRTDLEQAAAAARDRYGTDNKDAGLQSVLDLCGVPGPRMGVDSSYLRGGVLDMGRLDKGREIVIRLTIRNQTHGYLHGKVVSLKPWLRISSESEFACSPGASQAEVILEVNTARMKEITSPVPALEIRSNDRNTPQLIIRLVALLNPKLEVTWASKGNAFQPPIDFGEISEGEERQITRAITLTNAGGRSLRGRVLANDWLSPEQSPFVFGPLSEGKSVTFDIKADTTQLDVERSQQGEIPVKSNVGNTRVAAKVSVRKWWFVQILAVPIASLYALALAVLFYTLASSLVDVWWHGASLLQVVRSAAIEYLTRWSLLGMAAASVYLGESLIEELDLYYFGDRFRGMLPHAVLDRDRTIFVTLVLTGIGLVIGGVAEALRGEGATQVPVRLVTTTGASFWLGLLTTTRAIPIMRQRLVKIIRAILLTLAGSILYAAIGYVIASNEARYSAAFWGARLGGVVGLLVVSSEASLWPAVVRVRLRQVLQATLVITLGLVGFYGLDIFRVFSHPNSWNIPTHIHMTAIGGSDMGEFISSLFVLVLSLAGTVARCVVAFVCLLLVASAAAVAGSGTRTAKLWKLWSKALRSLQVGAALGGFCQSASNNGIKSLDFTELGQLYTPQVRDFLYDFTHWRDTGERNLATTAATYVLSLPAGYVALVGGGSLVLMPVLLGLAIVALVMYVIIMIIAAIITIVLVLLVIYIFLASQ